MQIARFSLIILIAISLFTTSCKNMFSELANKNTDDAIFYQAQREADKKNYDGAINLLSLLTDTYYSQREVQVFTASVYAGRCGLDYLLLADSAINNPGNLPIMQLALNHMKNATAANLADCKTAETLMRGVSPAGDGIMSDNVDDAFLMAFISLAKIGAELELNGDTGVGNPANDGVINSGFNACTLLNSVAPTNRPDIDIATGLTLIYTNLKSVNSVFTSKLTTLSTVCGTIGGTTCTKTNGATLSANELKSVIGVVNYNAFGVGSQGSYTPCP